MGNAFTFSTGVICISATTDLIYFLSDCCCDLVFSEIVSSIGTPVICTACVLTECTTFFGNVLTKFYFVLVGGACTLICCGTNVVPANINTSSGTTLCVTVKKAASDGQVLGIGSFGIGSLTPGTKTRLVRTDTSRIGKGDAFAVGVTPPPGMASCASIPIQLAFTIYKTNGDE